MVFVYKKLAQFAVRCALPPRRSKSPICATDNKPSCVLHLLGWFIGSRGFSSLERRPEFWVLHLEAPFLPPPCWGIQALSWAALLSLFCFPICFLCSKRRSEITLFLCFIFVIFPLKYEFCEVTGLWLHLRTWQALGGY